MWPFDIITNWIKGKIGNIFSWINLLMGITPVILFIIKMKFGTGVMIPVAFLSMTALTFLLMYFKEKKNCTWYPYILPALPITISLIIRYVGLKILPAPMGHTLTKIALIGCLVSFFMTPGFYQLASSKLCHQKS